MILVVAAGTPMGRPQQFPVATTMYPELLFTTYPELSPLEFSLLEGSFPQSPQPHPD